LRQLRAPEKDWYNTARQPYARGGSKCATVQDLE
jgi:hypothetical protein